MIIFEFIFFLFFSFLFQNIKASTTDFFGVLISLYSSSSRLSLIQSKEVSVFFSSSYTKDNGSIFSWLASLSGALARPTLSIDPKLNVNYTTSKLLPEYLNQNVKSRSIIIKMSLSRQSHLSQKDSPINDDQGYFGLLEKAGTMGNYQRRILIVLLFVGYLTGGTLLIAPYIFYQDPYNCPDMSGGQCLQYVCSLPPNERRSFVVYPGAIESLSSDFGDYRCPEGRLTIAFLISLMFSGNVIGPLGLTLLGPYMGRRMIFLLSSCLALVGFLLTLTSHSLLVAGIGLFLTASGLRITSSTSFYFIAETMASQFRQKFSVIIQVFEGAGVLLNVLWFYLFGNWEVILAIFYLLPLLFVLYHAFFYLKDTPLCLVTRYSQEEALEAFTFIAQKNHEMDSFDLTVEDIRQVRLQCEQRSSSVKSSANKQKSQVVSKQPKHIATIISLFQKKQFRSMTIILIVLHWVIAFQYITPSLLLSRFSLGIFINGIALGFSQLFAYILGYIIISTVKRRAAAYTCFTVTLTCSLLLLMLWDQNNNETNSNIWASIGLLLLIFVFRFAIAMEYSYFFVYINELYPTQTRVLGTGAIITIGGACLPIIPAVIEFCTASGFPIMLLFASFSFLGMFLSSLLPQTLLKETTRDPKSEIQLRNIKNNKYEAALDPIIQVEQLHQSLLLPDKYLRIKQKPSHEEVTTQAQ